MNPVDQSRRSGFRPRGGRGWLPWAVALLLLTGCETPFASRHKNDSDPLIGIQAHPTAVAAAGTGTGTAAPTSGPVPALPTSYSSQGIAAAAAGDSPTPTDPRHLAIPAPADTVRGAAPGGVTVGSPEFTPTGSTSRSPVANIQQMGAATPPAGPAGGTTAPVPSAAITTVEQAQQALKQHGVNWQRYDVDDAGQWKFQCGIPIPNTANMSRTYVSKGSFPDQLSAMRAVLADIEKTPK